MSSATDFFVRSFIFRFFSSVGWLSAVSLIWAYFIFLSSSLVLGIKIEIYKVDTHTHKMAQSGFLTVAVVAVIVAVSLPEGK